MISAFLERLHEFGESDAIIFDGRVYSYADVLHAVVGWRQFLADGGVGAGSVVTLEGPASPQACAGLVALIELGAIIVPLAALPDAKRAEFLDVAQVELVIRTGGGDRREHERTGRHAEHELYARLREEGHPGLVLFSSGTTGRSKASVLDFAKVLGRYGPPKRPQRIASFLNIDHIGGVNTLLHTLSQGGAIVTVPDRSPDGVLETIDRCRVQVLPTTPTFLNMVLISGALERHPATSLELVTYGTEPMPLQTLRRLKAAMPSVRFKQTYGLSELGILPTRSKDDSSLWVKIGGAGFDYKIVDGVLWVKSDMAMLGYLNAPAPFDEEGYFNTQDVVLAEGPYVRILGRSSEIINVGGEKVYPTEVENVILEIPNIAEATVSGQPSPVTGMVVRAQVALVEPEDLSSVRRRVRDFCRGRLEAFKVPALVEVAAGPQHSDRFKKIRSAV
jgi:acyl-CoA synthetase (AMP-forming)/AMP-acid ligase II